jgi:hypothetical protein
MALITVHEDRLVIFDEIANMLISTAEAFQYAAYTVVLMTDYEKYLHERFTSSPKYKLRYSCDFLPVS